MARFKKYEFRPDATRNDILGKLLLTRKQRQTFLRWFLFGVVCVVGLLIQDVVMSRVRIFGATTDLVPCLIFCICVLQGAESGCVFALIASLTYHFSGSAPGVACIPLITCLGVTAAIFRQAYLRQGIDALLLCLGACLLLYELATFGIALFLGQALLSRISLPLVTAGLSLLVVPIAYPILISIGKIGGETWRE